MYSEFDEDWGSPEISIDSSVSDSNRFRDEKRAIQMKQIQDNLEDAMDLLKAEESTATEPTILPLDGYKIQNKEGFGMFKRDILTKIEKLKNVPGHREFVLDLIIGCSNLLDNSSLRKIIGSIQTLVTKKGGNKTTMTKLAPQLPNLKHGGSTKSSFELDLHNYDDDDYDDDD
jgi:hypothetical protein